MDKNPLDVRTAILIAAIGTLGGAGGTALFPRAEIELAKRELQLEIRETISEFYSRLPPDQTRARIKALESTAEKVDPAYRRPTDDWR